MGIPFRIRQIKTQQFAMFPDKFVSGQEVFVESTFHFGINSDATDIRCVTSINYKQGDTLLMTTEVHCFFAITEEGSRQLLEQSKVEVGFLRYLATIATGTIRGIIHTKTENTALNPVVLPPVNLVEAIKDDFVFARQ